MCAHIWNYTNTLIQCCILLQWQRLGPPLFTVEQRPIALELLAKDLPPNTQTHTYLFPHYTVTSCTAYLPVPKMTSPLIYTLCLYKKKCSHSYRFSCQPRKFPEPWCTAVSHFLCVRHSPWWQCIHTVQSMYTQTKKKVKLFGQNLKGSQGQPNKKSFVHSEQQ